LPEGCIRDAGAARAETSPVAQFVGKGFKPCRVDGLGKTPASLIGGKRVGQAALVAVSA
jgi:hypothetical protein